MQANVGYQQPAAVQPVSVGQTRVVISQPQPTIIMQNTREWSHGLCACCEDLGECAYGIRHSAHSRCIHTFDGMGWAVLVTQWVRSTFAKSKG